MVAGNGIIPRPICGLQRIFVVCFICALAYVCHAARSRASRACQFPEKWTGTWFQKGVHPPIRIEGDIFSFKGKCISSDGDMFFIEDSREKCFRCVVIYEKHPNVLQYRETYCDDYRSLKLACSKLNVDAHLYSMFRVDAAAITCPFRGPYTFSYSRGHGECEYPISTIDSCTDDTHLLFRFQACADVMGTESSVEELMCLALWKEGAAHYLVGKMKRRKSHGVFYGEENNYRCFVFEYLPEKGGVQVSQSADQTCDGLVSPAEGSRTMKLAKSKHPNVGCHFPSWVTLPHRWHTLDGKKSYIFSHKNTSFRITHVHTDHSDTRVTCTEDVVSTSNSSTVVAYSMSGCNNGFLCMAFHRRNKHIIEIQIGELVRRPQEACQTLMHDSSSTEFVTLVTPSATSSRCPKLVETDGIRVQSGRVAVRPEICRDTAALVVGCRSSNSLEFLTTCASFRDVKSFNCHGGWEENGRSYLITGLRNTKTKYCFVYSANEKMTQLSGLHDTCHRTIMPGITGNLTFNISAAGQCEALLNRSQRPLSSKLIVNLFLLSMSSFFVR